MTDNDIIKALECCSQDNIDCEECPANGICDNDEFCFTGAILDLINRQKAEKQAMIDHIKCLQYENDKLQARNNELNTLNKIASQEAIKEFIKEFKDKKFDEFSKLTEELYGYDLTTDINRLAVFNLFNTCINDILEEMTER